MTNPWEKLEKNSSEFILQEDRQIIKEFNSKNSKEEFKIHTDILPFPFVGNVLEAPIVLLMLNPGYEQQERDNGFYNEFKDIFWKQLNHKYDEMEYPYYCLNPVIFSYSDYWPKRLKKAIIGITEQEFSKKVCNIQFFPYSSKNMDWSYFKKTLKNNFLESQEYNFYLVRKAMERNALILFPRRGSQHKWYNVIEGLKDYENQYVAKAPFGAYITENNFSKEVINKIVIILKQ